MKVRIDAAGRLVVPKRVRERFGFRTGVEIEMTEGPEGLLLRAAEPRQTLVREGALLVHTGAAVPGCDLRNVVEDQREDRIREIWSR